MGLLPLSAFGQNKPGTPLVIKKATGPIMLDGQIDEVFWQKADLSDDWYMNFPVDTALAPYQTECRLTFDEDFLYVSFVCYDDDSPDIISSLRCDFNTDRSLNFNYNMAFQNASSFRLGLDWVYQRLTNDFSLIDPDRYTPFREGEEYRWAAVSAAYQSNPRRLFTYEISSTYGGFYNGTNFNLSGELGYRYQPYGNIALRFDFNDLQLANGYGQEQLFLIGPRIDLTFSDELFLTTFIQYNNLLDNINLNARLQWRYQPASDFFLVYTENYLPENLFSKNRALVFKATYWLNL